MFLQSATQYTARSLKLKQVFSLILQNDNPGHSTNKILPLFLFSVLLNTTTQRDWTTDKKVLR